MKINIPEEMFTLTTTTTGTELSPEELEKMGWVTPIKYVENKYEQPCAIIEFCKRNPDVTSVCMTCNCPRCTVTCSTW